MKKILAVILAAMMIIGIVPIASFAADTGVPDGYIGVYSIEDLNSINNNLAGKYILMNDIDFSKETESWDPIGYKNGSFYAFSGVFDGNNKKITGLSLNKKNVTNIGFFGVNTGLIENTTFIDCKANVTIGSDSNFGLVCAKNQGKVYNCSVSGIFSVTTQEKFNNSMGIIVGRNEKDIELCKSYGDVDYFLNYSGSYSYGGDDAHFGGIAGFVTKNASIEKSSNYCDINFKIDYKYSMYIGAKIGGICGANEGNVNNSFNCGNIIAEMKSVGSSYATFLYLGGVIGTSETNSIADNCYNTGLIKVSSNGNYNVLYVGGLFGKTDGKHSNLFNTGKVEVTGKNYSFSGYVGGIGDICGSNTGSYTFTNSYYCGNTGVGNGKNNSKKLSNEEMKNQSSYIGFDFDDTWFLDSDISDYPQLRNNPEAKPHEHKYLIEIIDPSCTGKGYTIHVCNCGDTYKDTYVNALGHTFSEWRVTTPATCTKEGVETRYCVRCEKTETRTIAKIAHSYTDVVTEPTCTEKGYTTHTCDCGDTYVDSYVDATGHIDGEWKVTKPATYTAEGEKTHYCKECGEIIRTEVIPKLEGRVVSVSIDNVEVKYKNSVTIKPEIKTEGDIKYTVKYETSDPKIVTVDQNGNITTNHKGTAKITCTVTDEAGNVVKDTKTINVKFSFGQWLIWILLFGFLWY